MVEALIGRDADHDLVEDLAEALAAPLWTCDSTLAAEGHRATVRLAPISR